ncbi:MAG: four helix bundle protein [Anaerolineae bacterium]|nr:four helix bundle protein [Anaerolineae bacterium]
MGKIESHRDLVVWRKAMEMTAEVYRLAAGFPREEEYRLTSQLVRAAASVPANVAEGHARGTRKDYAHFVAVAKGSLAEAETFLLLALDLGLASPQEAQHALSLIEEISKMLTALRARLLSG